MGQQNRTTLKTYFETGDTPTQAQFIDLIDSQFNPSNDTLDAIPNGTTYKLVTAAEKTVLGNTSGTNTGDNATNSQYSGLAASKQDADADLTTIASLTATSDNILQSASSAWASRTPAQVTATLPVFVPDTGSGGAKGLAPATAAGDATKFLKGDGTWATPSGSGDVSKVGTPVNNQVGVWTGDGTLEGDADLTFDGTKLTSGSLAVAGTGGAGFLTLVGQASNPTAPAAGTLLLHSSTTNGFTRMEQDNEAATNLIYGRDNVFIAKNTSGGTISKGQVVYVTGSTGNVPNIAKAQANSGTTLPTVGVVVDDILNNAFGQVMVVGIISSFDTSAFSAGAPVWVSATVAGGLTATRPSGTTNFVQRVGSILVSGVGNGSILVNIAPAILNMETGTNAATWTGSAIVGITLTTSGGIELGHASDTTLTRVSAGVVAIEGVNIETTATTANNKIRTVGWSVDGAGSAITTGQKSGYPVVPFAGTITGYKITADTGTCTAKFWKIASGTAIPTVSNNINTSGVSLSSGTAIISSTTSDFTTTTVTANDIFALNITAVSGATKLFVELQITAN